MGYNPKFNINPDQLQLIEDALRAEIGKLAVCGPQYLLETNEELEKAKEIRALLGHLHNQKRWFNPNGNVPLG